MRAAAAARSGVASGTSRAARTGATDPGDTDPAAAISEAEAEAVTPPGSIDGKGTLINTYA